VCVRVCMCVCTCIGALQLTAFHHHQWLLYTWLVVPLLLARFVIYRRAKFHYFMLDWCYFCQVLLLVYVHVFPSSPVLFQAVFAVANGPLVIAIVMWRNSLVFHDLDKLTSAFIHLMPAIGRESHLCPHCGAVWAACRLAGSWSQSLSQLLL
jgi:Protein of unknown function (DUF2838)